jgi:hypothetical protein
LNPAIKWIVTALLLAVGLAALALTSCGLLLVTTGFKGRGEDLGLGSVGLACTAIGLLVAFVIYRLLRKLWPSTEAPGAIARKPPAGSDNERR